MSKTVKLDDDVKAELEDMLWKRETLSHGVKRLLEIRRLLLGIDPIIRGQKAFNNGKAIREAQKALADG